jgi:hypothetical protein
MWWWLVGCASGRSSLPNMIDFGLLFLSVYNTYAKIPPLASFHAGCDGNHSVESPEACHRIRTRRRGILIRKFHDRGHGMTWKGEATPHPLPTLCTIRSRKVTTAVTVAPKHTGDLNYFRRDCTTNSNHRLIAQFWHLGVSMHRPTTSEPPRLT